ncbi:MAG: hypothetical protein ABI440_03700, partial [Casimicrobiaceae bacterium]
VPASHFARRLVLPSPVRDAAALTFAVNRLVHDLAAWLLARGLGVTRIGLTLAHERHQQQRIGIAATEAAFALGTPTRTIAHLNAVLRERLARIELPAPIEAITLSSTEAVTLAGHNLDLLPGSHHNDIDVPLADRLRARLGEDSVVCIAPHAEHRPEAALDEKTCTMKTGGAAARDHPAAARPSEARPQRLARLRHGTQILPAKDMLAAQMHCAAPAAARPLWLLSEPASLSPAFERAPWILRDGPERIESGWWDGNDVRRDYFVAQTPDGGITWVYRDHPRGTDDGEWFLHGLFA